MRQPWALGRSPVGAGEKRRRRIGFSATLPIAPQIEINEEYMTGEINRCYRALELEPGASLEQVKQAWRELVKVWHPDRFPNDAKMQRKAQERLKAINGAYEVLTQFLASGTTTSEKQTAASDSHGWDSGESSEARTGRGAPPAPPSGRHENKPSVNPKKSKAKVICLLIFAFGVLTYSVNLAIQYHAFVNQLTTVRGIHIGDSRDQVKYRLGYPPVVLGALEENSFGGRSQRVFTVLGQENDVNKMPSTTKVEDYNEWVYEEPSGNVRLTVEFDKSGLVKSLNLYSNSDKSYGWGAVAGLHSGDSEDEVLKLGPPSQQNLDGVSKTIEYRDIGIVVTLSKGRAYMITIKEPQSKAALFWRFMRSYHTRG
jgi:hypothetical protein